MKMSNVLLAFSLLMLLSLGSLQAQQSLSNGEVSVAYHMPENFELDENWMTTYRAQMGDQTSLGWIAGMMADDAQLLVDPNTSGMILVFAEGDEMEDAAELEEHMTYASIDDMGAKLHPAGEVEFLGEGTFATRYSGMLSGVPVIAQKISMHSANGSAPISILAITPDLSANGAGIFNFGMDVAAELVFLPTSEEAGLMAAR